MCGIIGVFKRDKSEELVRKALSVIKYRGTDSQDVYSGKDFSIGHCLHSIVNFVKQPLVNQGIFAANCEIYNWKELNNKYNLNAKNDAEVLFKLLEQQKDLKNSIIKIIDELDGVYAFAYLIGDKLYLARDILGVKPLWYSHADSFSFASEKKALEKIGFIDVNELNPRKILEYDLKNDKINFIEREFFEIEPEIKDTLEIIEQTIEELLKNAVNKRVPERKFGILFSGGIDSTIIALILKKLGYDFTCYTSVLEDPELRIPEDLIFAEKVAKELDLKLKIIKIKTSEVEEYLKIIVPLIEDSNVVKVGVALTFFKACEEAKNDGCKVIFSGLGSEEIFAGYQRHKDSQNINKECLSGLLKIYERDLYRDDVITMFHNLELRLPFLDKKLVDYALKIPSKYKIINLDGKIIEKHILRLVAKNFGLKNDFAERKKKAAQYGSNFDKAIGKLARKNRFKLKSEYLRTFYPSHNVKLGALVSSGKDSIYALYVMLKQNYSIDCIISLKSKNPDSFMFHTPTIELVKLQAESMKIPLIIKETKGEKEDELEDLKVALKEAKEKHKIQGVVNGALFSNYQRERIEKICDSLSLKIFSPLWHLNQETEVREIITNGFKFIITKIAAEGLDKTWLNKIVDDEMIKKLVELNKKLGLNIAGEGGEYETLVLDGPIFSKRIEIKDYEILEEDKNTATIIIKKAD